MTVESEILVLKRANAELRRELVNLNHRIELLEPPIPWRPDDGDEKPYEPTQLDLAWLEEMEHEHDTRHTALLTV